MCALTHSPLIVDALQDAGASGDELRNVLIALVNAGREEDWPRLAYANLIEESGDAARSEFVRVQVELARIISHGKTVDGYTVDGNSPMCDRVGCNLCQLRRREEELVRLKLFPTIEMPVLLERWVGQGNYRPDSFAVPHRGFIDSITCSWQDWLAHHEKMYWHPKQTVECPECIRGMCNDMDIGDITFAEWPCENCGGLAKGEHGPGIRGTGRIPCPFVNTAQPVREVTISQGPWRTLPSAGTNYVMVDGKYAFDRVKCVTCDGWHLNRRVHECKECGGIDKNQWTCDRWPGVTFRMPETRATGRRMTDEERYHYGDIPLGTHGYGERE